MDKYLTHVFFLFELSPFLELGPFEKIRMKSCRQDISKKYLSYGLETWSADRGWWVDYLINFRMNSIDCFQISGKQFELGTSNLVSW